MNKAEIFRKANVIHNAFDRAETFRSLCYQVQWIIDNDTDGWELSDEQVADLQEALNVISPLSETNHKIAVEIRQEIYRDLVVEDWDEKDLGPKPQWD